MKIERLNIEDIFLIVPTKHRDQRGYFSETYRLAFLESEGVRAEFIQDNHVYSSERGVLRGLHFQIAPLAQGKLIRCIRGSILDVAVDIREGSPTFGQHVAVELSAANWKQVWVPPGFAHGYLTLEADCEVIYKVTNYYSPDCERGVAWDDPSLDIDWRFPSTDLILADKDRRYPRLADIEPLFQYR
jgi:dTDP-4-dehydrorhamnose 3,5-epimerase